MKNRCERFMLQVAYKCKVINNLNEKSLFICTFTHFYRFQKYAIMFFAAFNDIVSVVEYKENKNQLCVIPMRKRIFDTIEFNTQY